MATSTHRDPRSIITPDAFEVSEHLVGTPLAAPSRRAVALLIDGAVIAFLTLVTKSFALILGVVAAVFFMRAGFKRTKVRGSVFGRAMRFSVGCPGLFLAVLTAALWSAFGVDFGRGDADTAQPSVSASDAASLVLTGLSGLALLGDFEAAGSVSEARDVATEFIEIAEDNGMDRETLRATLLAVTPEGAAWAGEWEGIVEGLLDPGATAAEGEGSAVEDVADYTDEEALESYLGLISEGDSADPALLAVLQGRLGPVIAADTLSSLEARVRGLEEDIGDRDAALEAMRAELDPPGGVFNWVRGRLDDLGFGFGWAALYMTIFLSWWNGQTVGKRMMKVRVVRLDGEPITWWVAFERVGGYAAGFATGLLGFAQVWWDANRQGIHDRIVGTVVVMDGAERVEDWDSSL